MAARKKQRRPRTIGVEVRGSGPHALIAATVLQAVADLRQDGPLGEAAQEWLLSPGCHYCLDLLDIPYQPFLQALRTRRLCRGTSTRAFWEDAPDVLLDLVA
ncbi:MAG: hypothetical protein ACRDIB_15225 [Ardenticatenaceae bacterium]